jgi:FkbM family methyltransferase
VIRRLHNLFLDVARRTYRPVKDGLFTLFDAYGVKSYSQEGEDMILRRLFEGFDKGFYVDIGAHHPKRFSNTYFFYKRGWSGINVDAAPASMKLFRKIRPRDINLEVAVGEGEETRRMFIFDEPAFNSLDENISQERAVRGRGIRKEVKVIVKPLRDILLDYAPKDTKINFLSIDVEGLDLEVLRSNDWDMFRPQYVCVESVGKTISKLYEDEIYRFLAEKHYELLAKTVNTLIFRESPGAESGTDSNT